MKNTKYRYLPHTADIAFVSYGKTLSIALENSAEALLNIMLDLKQLKKRKAASGTILIKESAGSIENLVWYTLQDILTRIDEKKLPAYEFRVEELNQDRNGKQCVSGRLFFKKIKEDLFLLEVKAVTPHNLTVKKREDNYEIRVVVDV